MADVVSTADTSLDGHVCVQCGYSLKGLPDKHRCPECGTDFCTGDFESEFVRIPSQADYTIFMLALSNFGISFALFAIDGQWVLSVLLFIVMVFVFYYIFKGKFGRRRIEVTALGISWGPSNTMRKHVDWNNVSAVTLRKKRGIVQLETKDNNSIRIPREACPSAVSPERIGIIVASAYRRLPRMEFEG